MDTFIKNIIEKKTHCFFVSPHLDDAVLSAGGVLSQLSGKVPITVINVFTEATDMRPTLSARQFLKYSGYSTAPELFSDRKKEDMMALRLLHLTAINLGYVEALWRRRTDSFSLFMGNLLPEFAHVYPIYRFLVTSGHVSRVDATLQLSLEEKLKALVGNDINYLVFAPLGVGGHVDHWFVREVCEKVFSEKLVYWSDFPYNSRIGSVGNCPNTYKQVNFDVDMKSKEKLIRQYKSQVAGLFSGGVIPDHKEIYFVR